MGAELTAWQHAIQRCEAAIGRIRAAYRAGVTDTPAMAEDFALLQQTIAPVFQRHARRAVRLGPDAVELAYERMWDHFYDDLLSTGFPSLEAAFGAYLKHRPLRTLEEIARNYAGPVVSHDGGAQSLARLDHTVGLEDTLLGDIVPDTTAPSALDTLIAAEDDQARQATYQRLLALLPIDERTVIVQRTAGVSNNTIAAALGVSPATTSRMYTRALTRLTALARGEGATE